MGEPRNHVTRLVVQNDSPFFCTIPIVTVDGNLEKYVVSPGQSIEFGVQKNAVQNSLVELTAFCSPIPDGNPTFEYHMFFIVNDNDEKKHNKIIIPPREGDDRLPKKEKEE